MQQIKGDLSNQNQDHTQYTIVVFKYLSKKIDNFTKIMQVQQESLSNLETNVKDLYKLVGAGSDASILGGQADEEEEVQADKTAEEEKNPEMPEDEEFPPGRRESMPDRRESMAGNYTYLTTGQNDPEAAPTSGRESKRGNVGKSQSSVTSNVQKMMSKKLDEYNKRKELRSIEKSITRQSMQQNRRPSTNASYMKDGEMSSRKPASVHKDDGEMINPLTHQKSSLRPEDMKKAMDTIRNAKSANKK